MGGQQSSQPVITQRLPGPNNAIKTPPRPDALIVQNVFTPRRVPTKELQGSRWSKLPNEKPVYVAIPGIGVSVTGNVRYVDGIPFYAIHKLHPLSPENDIQYSHYLEVPETINKIKIIYNLKFAISQLWPNENYVKFITDEGTTFSKKFSELKSINDPAIKVAVEAIKKDYPSQLDPILSFREVEAPDFDKFDDEDDMNFQAEQNIKYTTLTPGEQSRALYKAYRQQEKCMRPKPNPKPVIKPRTATFIFPNCNNSLSSGLSSSNDTKDFEDVSDISNNDTSSFVSSEYNDSTSEEEYISDEYDEFENSAFNDIFDSLKIGEVYEY